MLIIGARGFAKEVLEVIYQSGRCADVVFYDDVNADIPELLFGEFPVLKTLNEAEHYFINTDKRFTIGIGNPVLRKKLHDKFTALGGIFTSTISAKSTIGHFGNSIAEGCNIMSGAVITSDVTLNRGVLVNLNCTIGHDSIIGEFVELSPGVSISGNCIIGAYSNVGSNATILPKVVIGQNVIVGAGSVVTKDVPDNCLVVGVPAVIKKQLPEIQI